MRSSRRTTIAIAASVVALIGALAVAQYACRRAAIPARGFLFAGETPPHSGAPHGYVVFPTRVAAGDARALAVCAAFKKNLEPAGSFEGTPEADIIVTYWPLAAPRSARLGECRWLVGKYDFAQGIALATKVGRPGARGPLLVAMADSASEFLVLDVADFSDADLDRAFGVWKDRVSRDPQVWTKGFQMDVIREAFRSFLEHYGQQILAVIKPAQPSPSP